MESKIIDAALKLFATKGYEGTTIREIGHEVGIKGSSIYSHFSSKEEIFIKVVNNLFVKIMDNEETTFNAMKSRENNDIRSLLFAVFHGYYNFFAMNHLELLFWQRLRFFPPFSTEGKFDVNQLLYEKPLVEIYLDVFKKGVETKQLKEIDPVMLVMSFFSFISGYTDSLILVPFKLSEEQLKMAFEIFWEGARYKSQ